MKKGIANLIATFFYVGLSPYVPGTLGTLAAIPLFYLLSFTPVYVYLAFTILIILISIWASSISESIYGKTDPRQIVTDEVCGYLVTMSFVQPTLTNMLVGFLFFRIFDIVKPPPAKQAERLHGGLGVVLDDVAAGIYANIVIHLMLKYAF